MARPRYNALTGTFPPELLQLNLTRLGLNQNMLSCVLPPLNPAWVAAFPPDSLEILDGNLFGTSLLHHKGSE